MLTIPYKEPIILTHKELGEGVLTSVRHNTAWIKFLDTNKSARYSLMSLKVNDPSSKFSCSEEIFEDYSRIISEAKKRSRWDNNYTPDISYKSEFNISAYLRDTRGPITRALNIPFDTEEEKIEAVAFLAALQPTIEARVYEGDSLDAFIQDYPGQPYFIDYCESSQIHATSFRINLSSNEILKEIMPSKLLEHMNMNSSAIFRTAFIRELMDDYGFNFGNLQDLDNIRRKIKETAYESLFETKYEYYYNTLKENNLLRNYNSVETTEELDLQEDEIEL